jgi:CubicO group peptidase (beta-lactamase class C family)
MTQTVNVEGWCATAFAGVRDAFARNFAEHDEVGASVCVVRGGEVVVDLWGGVADPASGRAWTEDTVGIVFSCTKGAAAICAHLLAQRGELDLDAPVASVWPEFAAEGKGAVTVAQLLAHQAGLAAWEEPLAQGGLYDWDGCCSALAAQAPYWEPGTRHGYHAVTFGHLVGEVVRRVSGRSLGTFFADEVAGPLGIDFRIGGAASEIERVAPVIIGESFVDPDAPLIQAVMADPEGMAAKLFLNLGGWLDPAELTGAASLEAEIPSANGIANARALAGLYAALISDDPLLSPDTLARAGAVASASSVDASLLIPSRFGLGFFKRTDNRWRGRPNESLLIPESAIGHPGLGGSIGFADPDAGVAFGYSMNRLGSGTLLNERGQGLVDATYAAL